jgi:Fe-S oxidoreductase
MLAEKNAKAFAKYSFKEIVTTDPHAYNAIKNEYPEMGISYPVKHYTQFLAERMDQLKPLLNKEIDSVITYHDPCYLGRVNDVYDEPRELIKALPGIDFVEMPHNRENSVCCGGGGGGMWLDGFQWEKTHARTSEWRICEAVNVGADIMVIACPYEKPRFEDAVKVVASDTWQCFGAPVRPAREDLDEAIERIRQTQHLQIFDLAELLLSSMEI